MAEMEATQLQEIANRLNLGKHQHLITAENEEGEVGRFIVHRPTINEEIRIGVDYARLKTPNDSAIPVDIDAERDNVAFMTATLNVVLDLRPDWFPKDAGESFDSVLIVELFGKYCEWKNCFRRRVSGESEADSGATHSA